MTKLSDQIKTLHNEGKSYKTIAETLKCSKGSISYHLNDNQKEKSRLRVMKLRKKHPYTFKLEKFLSEKPSTHKFNITIKARKQLTDKVCQFQRGEKMKTFTVENIIEKFGESPTCYLTGESIDINQPKSFAFDHKIPVSRNGTNTIDNLGICLKKVNSSKTDMTPEEYIELCKKVLIHNGYEVKPKAV